MNRISFVLVALLCFCISTPLCGQEPEFFWDDPAASMGPPELEVVVDYTTSRAKIVESSFDRQSRLRTVKAGQPDLRAELDLKWILADPRIVGPMRVKVRLFPVDRVTAGEPFRYMPQVARGFRPANIEELLAYGLVMRRPAVSMTVIALNTSAQIGTRFFAPALVYKANAGVKERPVLALEQTTGRSFGPDIYFLGVEDLRAKNQ